MSVSNLFRTNDYNIFCNDFTVDGNLSYDGSLTFEEINIKSTTESSSTSTGALIVAGGVGIERDLRVGGTIYGTVNGTVSATSLQLTDTTGSISTSTGTLTVGGGVGIGENLYVGKNLNVLGGALINGSNIYTSTNNLHIEALSNKVYLKGTSYFQNPSDTSKYFSISTDSGGNTNLKSWGTNAYTYYDSTNYLRIDSNIDASPTTGALQLLNGGLYVNKSIYVNGTTISNSTSQGALIVNGGVGIAGNLNVGNSITIESTNSTMTCDTIFNYSKSLRISSDQYQGSLNLEMHGVGGAINMSITNDSSINNIETITNSQHNILISTESTSVTTGTMVISGGVGIAGNLNVGGIINAGNVNVTSTTNLKITNTTNSTNPTTGVLIVNGGVGISDDVYMGGLLGIGGSPTFYSSFSSSINADYVAGSSSIVPTSSTGIPSITNGMLYITSTASITYTIDANTTFISTGTIRCKWTPLTTSVANTIFWSHNGANYYNQILLGWDNVASNLTLIIYDSGGTRNVYTYSFTPTINTEYDIEVDIDTSNGSNIFLNGVMMNNTIIPAFVRTNFNNRLSVGDCSSAIFEAGGNEYVRELKIYNYVLHTTNFVPLNISGISVTGQNNINGTCNMSNVSAKTLTSTTANVASLYLGGSTNVLNDYETYTLSPATFNVYGTGTNVSINCFFVKIGAIVVLQMTQSPTIITNNSYFVSINVVPTKFLPLNNFDYPVTVTNAATTQLGCVLITPVHGYISIYAGYPRLNFSTTSNVCSIGDSQNGVSVTITYLSSS